MRRGAFNRSSVSCVLSTQTTLYPGACWGFWVMLPSVYGSEIAAKVSTEGHSFFSLIQKFPLCPSELSAFPWRFGCKTAHNLVYAPHILVARGNLRLTHLVHQELFFYEACTHGSVTCRPTRLSIC